MGIFFLAICSSTNLSTMGKYDSCVFLTVGFSWTENILPYRDLFDHKGPVLYILNALGFILYNEFYGVLFIEILFASINTIIFFLLCGKNKYSFLIFYIFIAFYYKTVFEYGNMTEEYAITFNMIAIYIFSRKFTKRFYYYGLLGGLLFFLRPNLAAPTLLIFFIDLICSRKTDVPLRLIAKCALGFCIPVLSFIFYFYCNNGLHDFINSYFIFNFKYTNLEKESFLRIELLHLFKNFYFYINLLFIFCLIATKDFKAFLVTFSTFIFSLLMSAISSRNYDHYFMLLIPSILFTISTVIKLYNTDTILIAIFSRHKKEINSLKRKLQTPLVIGGLSILCMPLIVIYIGKFIYCLNKDNLTDIRNFFYKNGITQQASILNLSNHNATKLFYILKIAPKEKDFFPETASITNKHSETLKNNSISCPNEEYDLIIVPQDKELSCSQYTLFTTPLNNIRIYKKNVH